MLDIFVSMLTIQVSEEAYPGLLAELSYSFTVKDRGIMLKVEGYNEKLPVCKIFFVKIFVVVIFFILGFN